MASPLDFWTPPKPTSWQRFRRDPIDFLAFWLHKHRPPLTTKQPNNPITIVCISDTHDTQPEVPDGDLLLHAGDLTNDGSSKCLQAQIDWLASLPHKHKVVIAGNHDKLLDAKYVAQFPHHIYEEDGISHANLHWHDLIYLHNSSKTLEFANGRKLNVFGSPWTPKYGSFAFQYPPVRDVWMDNLPDETDILLTHGPPKGYLDLGGKGCPHLMREVARAPPRLMVFGHIHAGHGQEVVGYRGIERAYQKVMAGGGGYLAVLTMVIWLLAAWVIALVSYFLRVGDSENQSRTIMVNAAVVHGMRNDKRRSATIVSI